uniref:Uncharacterized protein n=1 Tax=Xiphophorus couchianus TaxID=32473 RepID=A0A3B5L1Z3_9TELE
DESSNSLRTPEKEDGFHEKSHQLQYPDSFHVPEEKVPFKILHKQCFAKEIILMSLMDPAIIRNPGGRTGIKGRGALSRLGPNLNLDLVVTRWRDSVRSVLEFLAVLNQNLRSLALPGVSGYWFTFYKLFEALDAKVSEGYVDDCRNTDNAWVETTVLNIHLDGTSQVMFDRFRRYLTCCHPQVISGDSCLQWQEVSSRIKLSPNQRRSLQQVAELLFSLHYVTQ